MSIYKKIQSVAADVLREFDQATASDDPDKGIWYVAVAPGNGPPDNPGPPVETPYKVDGAARGVKFKYVTGSDIVASDLQATMAVIPGLVPSIAGFVKLDGARYKIVRVDPVPPVGDPVVYRLFFRK
jgi:hypothetical protein